MSSRNTRPEKDGPSATPITRVPAGPLRDELAGLSQRLAHSSEQIEARLENGDGQPTSEMRDELEALHRQLLTLMGAVCGPLARQVKKLDAAGALTDEQRERIRGHFAQMAEKLESLRKEMNQVV